MIRFISIWTTIVALVQFDEMFVLRRYSRSLTYHRGRQFQSDYSSPSSSIVSAYTTYPTTAKTQMSPSARREEISRRDTKTDI